jgi:ferrous iron transport protein B
VLWVLASYGPQEKMARVDEKYALRNPSVELKEIPGYKSEKLEQSYAGHFGRVIEPVIKPLGFDWKIGIGLLTSFAAREVFVGTMNTIYGLGSDASEQQLSEVLASQVDQKTGKKVFDAATSLSLMVFFLLAMQCMSTFAVVRRETNSFKIAFLQLVFMTVCAYFASLATYQLVQMFG